MVEECGGVEEKAGRNSSPARRATEQECDGEQVETPAAPGGCLRAAPATRPSTFPSAVPSSQRSRKQECEVKVAARAPWVVYPAATEARGAECPPFKHMAESAPRVSCCRRESYTFIL